MAGYDKELRNWLHFLLRLLVVGCILPAMHSDPLALPLSYEIIIPRRLEPETGEAKKEELSYVIQASGKEHIIRLKRKNNFLAENLPVFTYDSEGRKVKSHPYIPAGCYYGGYVEGMADSLVALSTCFGLRGFLKIRGLNYGLEPLEGSRTFQHLLYLTNKTGFNSTVCGLRNKDPNPQAKDAGRGNVGLENDLLYLELYVVVENKMFRYEGGNETRVIHIVLDTINMVYTHYRVLNIAVTLVGMNIWKARNPIQISSDSQKLIDDFNEWKVANDKEIQRDTTRLFVHQRFDRMPWESYRGGICSQDFPVGIDPYLTKDLSAFSIIVSHSLGHTLGLHHDGPYCFCDEQASCIMHHSYAGLAMFSNCSVASMAHLRRAKELDCLRNIPRPPVVAKHCGNRVVDVGEQCDCGDAEQCTNDPCCHPDCTFKGQAVCSHEDCCQRCQFTPTGMLCRNAANLCDLPEYCTGESMWCPADVHKKDGTPCNEDAYCYAKKCSTHNLQCADIFGKDAKAAPHGCFKALNMAGDQVGNCGGGGEEGETFVKCKEKDVLCGRLHCSNVQRKLDPLTEVQFSVNGVSCWSTKYQHHHGEPISTEDKGVVPDGTACSEDRLCLNWTCVPASILKSECDPNEKCHGRGVCNNRNNCHCDFGWGPPNCTTIGAGGSIDSGSPTHAFTMHVLSLTFKVLIPVLVLGVAVITLLGSKLRQLFNRHRQRISSRH